MKITIYTRERRVVEGKGKWRFNRVATGRGHKTSDLQGPFYLRHTAADGRQTFAPERPDTFEAALKAAERLQKGLEAQSKGLTVTELSDTNNGRIPIQTAVERFLQSKENKATRTKQNCTADINSFASFLSSNTKVKFLDDLAGQPGIEVQQAYQRFMRDVDGYSSGTIRKRLLMISNFLTINKQENPFPSKDRPAAEGADAVPFDKAELDKIFAAMNEEEWVRYRFLLDTACRRNEARFATWADIDFVKKGYTVRAKPEVDFYPKSHYARFTPISDRLIEVLKKRKQNPPHPRWLFVNEDGEPDNRLLRQFKAIALRAGVNCGQCRTRIEKNGKIVDVTCKTDPVCEHWYLHRLRKTKATWWSEAGNPVRSIQKWLGHSSLEVTQVYLGETDSSKLRDQINAAAGD